MNGLRRVPALRSASVLLVLAAGLVFTLGSFALGFSDVPQTNPYADAIADLSSRRIVEGFSDGTFGPGMPVKRQQFAKMIVLTAGLNVSEADVCPFSDVDQGGSATFYPDNFVAVAAAHGITTGINATTFSPSAEISRAQVISMVVRALDGLRPELLATPPAAYASTWDPLFSPAHGQNCRIAEYNGLMAGLPLGDLDPWGPMPRGEVAQVLHDYLVLTGASSTTTTGGSTSTTGGSTTTTGGTTSTTGATTSTTLTGLPTGDLLVFSRRAGSGSWTSVDVSERLGGQQIADTIVAWGERGSTSEPFRGRIAAMDPGGDLLVLSEQPDSSWEMENVTGQTGQRIAGPVTMSSGLVSGNRDDLELLAEGPDNDLIYFSQAGDGPWSSENVSAATGVKVSGKVNTKSGWLVVRTPTADVVRLDYADGSWQVENLSEITGQKASAAPASWTNVGDLDTDHTYVAFRSLQGRLTVLWTALGTSEWHVMTSQRNIEGTPYGWTGWYDGGVYTSQLACVSGERLVFMWASSDDSRDLSKWETQNPSILLNQKAAGTPTGMSLWWGWQNDLGWEEEIQTASPEGQLVTFRSSLPGKWRADKASPPAGLEVVGMNAHWSDGVGDTANEETLYTAALGVR